MRNSWEAHIHKLLYHDIMFPALSMFTRFKDPAFHVAFLITFYPTYKYISNVTNSSSSEAKTHAVSYVC